MKRSSPFAILRNLFGNTSLTGLFICLIFIYIAQHATHSNWSFFTEYKFGWTPVDIGLSLGFVGIMIAIVQAGVVGSFVKKFGEVKAIYIGLFLNVVGLLLMGFVWKSWMVYVVIIPYAFGGLAGPSLQSVITSKVSQNSQGELQGGLTSLMTFTNVIGPLIMTTWIFSYFTNAENGFDQRNGTAFPRSTLLFRSIASHHWVFSCLSKFVKTPFKIYFKMRF